MAASTHGMRPCHVEPQKGQYGKLPGSARRGGSAGATWLINKRSPDNYGERSMASANRTISPITSSMGEAYAGGSAQVST
jgi:hypothetical protein